MLFNYALAGFAAVAFVLAVEIAVLRRRLFPWREQAGGGTLMLVSPVFGMMGIAIETGGAGLEFWITLLLSATVIPVALAGAVVGMGFGFLLLALVLRSITSIWLYVPILLSRIPAKLRDEAGRQDFLARQNTTIWEWLQIVIALGALAYAVWFALDWSQIDRLQEVRDGTAPLTPYHILFMLDFDRLVWWNAVSVPAALLTVVLWLWTNHARRKGVAPMGGQVTALLLAMNLRNWLAYAWCLIAAYAFVGDAWALCRFPPDFGLLLWLYGPVSCQTPIA